MGMQFTAIDPDVARQSLAKKQRVSKHRETLQAFHDAQIPAAQIQLEVGEDGKEPNKGSVASGLMNALKAAKENKVPWAEIIQVRNRADGVFLINKNLLSADDDTEPEDEGAEPIEDEDNENALV